MKPFSIVALSFLAAIASAIPDHFQTVPSVLCTDVLPAVTVTITVTSVTTNTGMITQSSTSATNQLISSFTEISTTTTTSTAPLSHRTIDVLVGAFSEGNGTEFLFKPNNITANVGDVVRFNMLGKAHSVTQSQFARPCIKNGTFDTQLQPNPMNVTGLIFEEFTVDVTTPLWFYCKQTNAVSHCGKGMVFGINPKSQVQMEQFIMMAEAQNGTFGSLPSTSTSAAASVTSSTMVTVTVVKTNTGMINESSTTATNTLNSFSTGLPAITTTSTAVLSQRTIDVLVGAFSEGNGANEFLFKPNNITANVGDVVRFNMLGKAHSVTQSQFARPCIKNGTFDTQLQPNPMNVTGLIFEEFRVDVTTPLWFYCKQTNIVSHCGKGMVFGINPKSQVQMEQFIMMAEAQNGTFETPPSTSASAVAPATPATMAKRANTPRIRGGRSAKLF